MRAHAFFALCAAALSIPANAAPAVLSTNVELAGEPTMTVIINAGSDAPALPVATNQHENAHLAKNVARPPALPVLRRGVNFRQADYGVHPNVTFGDDALRPVAGVETSPTAAAIPATHSRRWKSYAQYGADDLKAANSSPNDLAKVEASPSPAAAAPDPSAIAGDVSGAGKDDGSSLAASSDPGDDPIQLGNPTDVGTNHVPAKPNLSKGSLLAGQALKESALTRYETSYAAHDALGAIMAKSPNAASTMPSAADVEKAHSNFEKTNYKVDHSIHRRVLAPASYISTPVRRMKQFARDLVQFVARHSFEVNTATLLPERQDQTLNMSDPAVMREEARKKNIGLINIDSNKAAPIPKPKPDLAAAKALNTTQVDTATGNATKGA